jgi:hypothetical protein
MESIVKDLPNIADYKDISHIPFYLAAILFVDVFVLFLTRYFPERVGGESLNDWYDNFGYEGVTADVFIILIGYVIAQVLYTNFIQPRLGWQPALFILLAMVVQVIHDVFFYYAVILPIPKGHNSMIDTYKKYAEENGIAIIPGDSGLILFSGLFALLFASIPIWITVMITILTVYALPYILNTKRQGAYRFQPKAEVAVPATQPKPQEQKEPIKVPLSPWDTMRGREVLSEPMASNTW